MNNQTYCILFFNFSQEIFSKKTFAISNKHFTVSGSSSRDSGKLYFSVTASFSRIELSIFFLYLYES